MSAPVAAVEISSATKAFGPTVAVNQVSFQVAQGECYGLIGPNGAGKTTLFSLLCGYLKPTSGQVRILGQDPRHPGAIKGKLGVLPQDAAFPTTYRVGPLLTYWARLSGLAPAEKHAREAIERVALAEAWNVEARALSHGMAKRIAMAQALMGSPPVVFLDEPTAGLDPRIAAHVRQLIREMKGGQTVVVSSHNLHELEELCDGAAILDRGRLAQAGSMAELTARAEEFRVQLARGEPDLTALRALEGCTAASWDEHTLVVQFDGRKQPPEEMITRTLELLIRSGAKVLAVSRGRKLEERVLQLT